MWVGTDGGGLNRFDPKTETFVRFQNNPSDPNSLGNNSVRALFEDPKGRIWAGTFGGGLNLCKPETGTFIRLSEQSRRSE